MNTLAGARMYRPYLSGFADPLDAAAEWADGFRFGAHLYPEMHALLAGDHEALTLMTAVLGLLRDEDVPEELRANSPFRNLTPERRAAMRRETVEMLPQIVPALHGHLHDRNEENAGSTATYVRQAPKVGRNDPCPCGRPGRVVAARPHTDVATTKNAMAAAAAMSSRTTGSRKSPMAR